MKNLKYLILPLLAIGLLAANYGSSFWRTEHPQKTLVRLQLENFTEELKFIQEKHFDVAGVSIKEKIVDLVVTENELAALKMLKLNPTVVTKMLAAPSAEYQNPDKIQTALHDYAARFPNLTLLKSAGKTLEGRDIWAIKISANAATHDPRKPAILFNSMHHAREIMTPEVALDTIDYLLTRYGTDTKVTHWVDSNEIWVVPMVNPDGNNVVWKRDSMWRKNVGANGKGVDINRNYPYKWNSCQGSSGTPTAQDYRGPSAASEPETRVLMSLVSEIRPVFDISYHSYSELVLYPAGCRGQYSLNREVVESIGKEMASLLPSDSGSGTYEPGTPWEILYAVDGDDIDWMHGAYNVIPYVIELNGYGQGFQPDYKTWRNKTVTKLRAAWQLLLERVDESGIRGIVSNSDRTELLSEGSVTFTKSSDPNFKLIHQIHPNGSFHAVLQPGEYQLLISSPGFQSQSSVIKVADARVDLNLSMRLQK